MSLVKPEDVRQDLVDALTAAVEGECDGLAITNWQARMILGCVLSAQQDAPTGADLQQAWYDAVGGTFVPEDVLAFGRMVASRYAPAQDAERERDAGIEAAARWIDTRRDDFDREHGYEDPDTGALEYGTGPHAEAKREYSFELAEIAEGLRALKSDAARAQHASDCALHNGPAYEPKPCDCGANPGEQPDPKRHEYPPGSQSSTPCEHERIVRDMASVKCMDCGKSVSIWTAGDAAAQGDGDE